MNNWDPNMIKSGRIKMVCGDGRKGYHQDAPYDAIHVGAAAHEIPEAVIFNSNRSFIYS